MQIQSLFSARLASAFVLACALSACGGSGGGGFVGSTQTPPTTTPAQPDTAAAPVKSCAP